jgi:hypothetical protein
MFFSALVRSSSKNSALRDKPSPAIVNRAKLLASSRLLQIGLFTLTLSCLRSKGFRARHYLFLHPEVH